MQTFILFHTTSLSLSAVLLLFAFQSDSLTFSVSRPELECFAVAPSSRQLRQKQRQRQHETLGMMESRKTRNGDQIMMMQLLALSGRDIDNRIDNDISSIHFENMEEYTFIEEEEENVNVMMDNQFAHDTISNEKNLIKCSASVVLPFSEDVAFDAFSDLTRQPSWCKYLHSVEYIGVVEGNDANNDIAPTLRQSRWTIGVKGLRFSWTAKDTRMLRPNHIEWESTSGLKNMGSVTFCSKSTTSSSNEIATEMTICFTFVAPRVVSSLFRRSSTLRKYTEEVLLGNMLSDFRDCLVKEQLKEERNDSIISPQQPHNQNPK